MRCICEKQTGFFAGLLLLYEEFSLKLCCAFFAASSDRLPYDLTVFIGNIQEHAVTLPPTVQNISLPGNLKAALHPGLGTAQQFIPKCQPHLIPFRVTMH